MAGPAISDGSPPRLRGILLALIQGLHEPRFTPAPAGNTQLLNSAVYFNAVHPRACGEYVWLAIWVVTACGSPPRLRGIQPDGNLLGPIERFTPAPAGNTSGAYARNRPAPVHPRACGEYSLRSSTFPVIVGSPPRLRGIRHPGAECGTWTPVHPRACGEYVLSGSDAAPADGSPPRLRGIPVAPVVRGGAGRFTPAPAGNTDRQGRGPVHQAVHPRACGEYAAGSFFAS